MVEVRIHGRGGQGGVTLAKLIATSRFLRGDRVQAFGLYAAERSGAPVQAFCRWSSRAIIDRNIIYRPDHVVVLDPTLIGPGVTRGLEPGGWILLNSPEAPSAFRTRFPHAALASVDATAIARENGLGTRSVPIVNTTLAGAFARVLGLPLEDVEAALDHLGLGGGNVVAARQAYHAVETLAAPGPAAAGACPEAEEGRPEGVGEPPEELERYGDERLAVGFVDGAGGAPPTIRTGTWASEQPRRQQWVPPCNHVCPAGNDVQGFLRALAEGQVDRALAILLETTPFPSVCGRVCPGPCMEACNRDALDGPVNVRQLERFAGDHGQVALRPVDIRSERVAVVGGGPAGLSAGYHLGRLGYQVVLYEAGDAVGGLLRTGIPGYRLPTATLERELGRIARVGVTFVTDAPMDRRGVEHLRRHHDAVIVATGLQSLRDLPGAPDRVAEVEQGIGFLDAARRGETRADGQVVVVVGGGNTAVDAARTALRLGAASVRILYRRSRPEMPAIAEEVEAALEEGVEIDLLCHPVAVRRPSGANGGPERLLLTCRRMELGPPDASGRPRPVEVPGSDHEVPCDRMILALGQFADPALFPEGVEPGEAEVHDRGGAPLFAVGDVATGAGTVAAAIGSGRRVALRLHAALGGGPERVSRSRKRGDVDVIHTGTAGPGTLRFDRFERIPRQEGDVLPLPRRRSTFEEVRRGLPDLSEARRCLSCGVCNDCDLCVSFCPDGVLRREGPDLRIDYAYCKGCGVCVEECPRGVLFMRPVQEPLEEP